MNERVSVSINQHVAEVQLNRPDKYNCLDPAMFDAIAAAGESLRQNDAVRVVILHGAGKHFCSGLDVSSFGELASSNKDFAVSALQNVNDSDSNKFQRCATVWHDLDVPVIAAVHGICYGGGLQIALGADLRYVRRDARFSVMEIRWGLVPDMGITQALRKLSRIDVAKELLFTGRVFDAEEALSMGLVTRVVDEPLNEARAMAEMIADNSPDAIQRNKRLLERSWDMNRADGLALEAELQSEVIFLENQLEAVAANLEKRKPNFK